MDKTRQTKIVVNILFYAYETFLFSHSVDNPLFHRSPDELERDVRQFHVNHQLEEVVEVEQLIRGAFLARDKILFMSNEDYGPDDVERRALEREDDPKLFQQPKPLLVVIWACCIGAIVQ